MGWLSNLTLKLNPAQRFMGGGPARQESSNEPTGAYEVFYDRLEVVQRGVNMIVDDASDVPFWVGDQVAGATPVVKGVRKKKIETLLTSEPNPFQDISSFKRNLYIDLILDGNIFIYFDGAHLYHLPACKMQIVSSSTTYIEKYTFNNEVDYKPSEIIHVKENSFGSIYRGRSRLFSALNTMNRVSNMKKFQDDFFKNGAVLGLVIETPDTLSQKLKDRLIGSWQQKYKPNAGGKTPFVLDGGMKIGSVSETNFREMDFKESLGLDEERLLTALGVPPILLKGGNNANIRPNMRMYYIECVIPAIKKVNKALERHFGYVIEEDLTKVAAMQPEMSEQASYFSTLTNGGIISANESRKELGYAAKEGHDDLRIPANIAGSAANPSEGGRPTESED